jgi:hypothetical protein
MARCAGASHQLGASFRIGDEAGSGRPESDNRCGVGAGAGRDCAATAYVLMLSLIGTAIATIVIAR